MHLNFLSLKIDWYLDKRKVLAFGCSSQVSHSIPLAYKQTRFDNRINTNK